MKCSGVYELVFAISRYFNVVISTPVDVFLILSVIVKWYLY